MTKTLKMFIALLALALSALTLFACKQDGNDYTLHLEPGKSSFMFATNDIDFSQIVFEVKDRDGNVVSTKQAEQAMLSADDLLKLKNAGTYTVTINYMGQTLAVQLNITQPQRIDIYSLTFNALDGVFAAELTGASNQSTYSVTTEKKNTVTELPVPQRNGYQFMGWYTSTEYTGNAVGAPYTITYDHMLYARWVSNEKRTVIFVSDFSDDQISVTVELHGSITVPVAVNYEGYIFEGWLYGENLYQSGQSISDVTENGFVRATYRRITFTVLFRSSEWEEELSYTVNYKGNFTNYPALPEKAGYTGQWIDKDTNKAPVLENIISNRIVEAKYTIKKFEVRFFGEAENLVFTMTQDYGTRVNPIPAIEKKEGYTAEWQYLNSGKWQSAANILSNAITANYDIYAKYTVMQFRVTYRYAGTSSFAIYDYHQEIDTPVDLSTTYHPKYYSIGWYKNSTFNESQIASFPFTVTTDITLYGKITKNPFRVDFRMPAFDNEGNAITGYNGDLLLKTAYVQDGGAMSAPAFSHAKYQVLGWTDRNGTPVNLNSITDFMEYHADPALDKAIYAVLGIRSYSVTYYNMSIQEGTPDNPYVYQYTAVSTASYRYGTVIINNPAEGQRTPFAIDPEEDFRPIYPGQTESTFVFRDWYTTTRFNTSPVNFDNGYTVTGMASFYTQWEDTEKGTAGLQFTLVDNGVDPYYALTGFVPEDEEILYFNEIFVPRQYNFLPVMEIRSSAFAASSYLTINYIKISKLIVNIEEESFAACATLKGFVFIDDEVSDHYVYQDGALYSVDSGELLCYAAGITAEIFTAPVSISAPSGLVEIIGIAPYAFSLNRYLKTLQFAANSQISYMSPYAFYSCQALETVTLPQALVTIGEHAFDGCYRLGTIYQGSNNVLLEVGEGAFADTAWFTAGSNTLILADVLIRYSGMEKTLQIDNSVRAIADGAFFSDSVTLSLESIWFTAASNIQRIGYKAFGDCAKLSTIYLLAPRAVWVAPNSFNGIKVDARLYVPGAYYSAYTADANITSYFALNQILIYA